MQQWPGTDHRLVRGGEVRRIEEAEERSSRDEYKERFTHGKRFHRTMTYYVRIWFLEVQCVHSRLHGSDI